MELLLIVIISFVVLCVSVTGYLLLNRKMKKLTKRGILKNEDTWMGNKASAMVIIIISTSLCLASMLSYICTYFLN